MVRAYIEKKMYLWTLPYRGESFFIYGKKAVSTDAALMFACFATLVFLYIVDIDSLVAFLQVADQILDAVKAGECHDTLDAVCEYTDTEQYTHNSLNGFGVAQGEETENHTAETEQEHYPPPFVARPFVVER